MPAAPNLPTSITAGSTPGHAADHTTIALLLNGLYLASIGGTKTTAYTLTQADSGDILSINSASSVAITVPVLAVGTHIELLRYGVGAVTLTAAGTTLRVPVGATASPRVQYSIISLLWRTTAEVIVGGDLA